MMDRKYIPPPKISDEQVATVSRSKDHVWALFEAIKKSHGEDTARKMFAPYGRALTKSDKRIRKDAALLWRLASMEKPNIKALAREIAGEGGKKENVEKYRKRIERTERHLKRIKRDPRIRKYVEDQASEWSTNDGEIPNAYRSLGKELNAYRSLGKELTALGYLRKNDPPDEE